MITTLPDGTAMLVVCFNTTEPDMLVDIIKKEIPRNFRVSISDDGEVSMTYITEKRHQAASIGRSIGFIIRRHGAKRNDVDVKSLRST